MKTKAEILKIADDLRNGEITIDYAQLLLTRLFSVDVSNPVLRVLRT